MPPSQPNSPRLWGNDAAETEASRGVDRLRLTWDTVAGADGYEIRVDGGASSPAQPDVTPIGFAPNTLHSFDVRAHDVSGWSPWSVPFETVTRPFTPPAPTRKSADLTLWGVALQWLANSGFPGGEVAYVEVWRRLGGTDAVISSRLTPHGEWLDETDPDMAPKIYWLRLVVPAAAVPGNALGADNVSFFGDELQASGPLVYRAVVPTVQTRPTEKLWRHYYGGGLRL
jgi:hypothetical protein